MNEIEIREKPITWDDTGLVMFLDGWAWADEFIEKKAEPPALRCWDVVPICLGKEEDVKAILSGQKPVTEARGEKEQMALREILQFKEDKNAGPAEIRGRSPKRSRPIGVARHKQANTGRAKVRQRLPRR